MNAKTLAVVATVYLSGAALTYAGAIADMQWNCHHSWANICDDNVVAKNRGLAAMAAVFPPGWFSILFVTGVYYHGFTFVATPAIQRSADR